MPASSHDRLAGIRLKIERAKEHVNNLERLVQSFRETNPYAVRTEDDPQTGDRVYRIQIRSQIPPALALASGEAIHQLRSSLDHLAWQLVEANGSTSTRATYFPICEAAAKYKTNAPGMVKGMSAEAIRLIDAFKPYKGGNDSLWKLRELNNIDKHRFLLVAAFGQRHVELAYDLMDVTVSPLSIQIAGAVGIQADGRVPMLQDGAEFARVLKADRREKDVDLKPAFEIAFGEPEIVQGEPAIPFLHQLCRLIDEIVNTFKALL